jgi:death on curing protein
VKPPVWVLREVVVALHEQLLAEFGGTAGIRDRGLLDSALARAENLLSYGKPTIYELAAAYCFGLVKNHPFVDGNKRIGFAVTVVFLEINGYHFRASEADAIVQVLALAAGDLSEAECAAWLASSSRKRAR